jgi:hypothetical protein
MEKIKAAVGFIWLPSENAVIAMWNSFSLFVPTPYTSKWLMKIHPYHYRIILQSCPRSYSQSSFYSCSFTWSTPSERQRSQTLYLSPVPFPDWSMNHFPERSTAFTHPLNPSAYPNFHIPYSYGGSTPPYRRKRRPQPVRRRNSAVKSWGWSVRWTPRAHRMSLQNGQNCGGSMIRRWGTMKRNVCSLLFLS